jgi:hypothetical protein
VVLLTLALLWSGPASADCSNLAVLPGTRGEQLAQDTRELAADTFGAAQTLNREVLPFLRTTGMSGTAVSTYAGLQSYRDIVRVPAVSVGGMGGSNCERSGLERYGMYPFDVDTVNVAVAVRSGPIGLVYSTSALATHTSANRFQRGMITTLNTVGGLYWVLAGPFYGAEVSEATESNTTFTYDYVIGGTFDAWVARGTVGYVGSKGVYAHVTSDRAWLFGNFVSSNEFELVPLLSGGLTQVPIAKAFTSAYVRRLDIDPSALGEKKAMDREGLWTAHLDQDLIARMFDVKGALAVKPTTTLQAASVTWHPAADFDDMRSNGLTTAQLPGVWAGTSRQLDQAQYGIEGGYRIQAGARYSLVMDDTDGLAVVLTGSVSLNDDAVMEIFPYAQNTWYLRLSVNGMSTGGDE